MPWRRLVLFGAMIGRDFSRNYAKDNTLLGPRNIHAETNCKQQRWPTLCIHVLLQRKILQDTFWQEICMALIGCCLCSDWIPIFGGKFGHKKKLKKLNFFIPCCFVICKNVLFIKKHISFSRCTLSALITLSQIYCRPHSHRA